MGVFDFVKEAGASIGLGGADEKSESKDSGDDSSVADVAVKEASEARAEEVAEKARQRRQEKAAEARREKMSEAKKSRQLEGYVTKLGLEVTDLDVRFDDGVATVEGTVADQATKEKVVLAVGNTAGVSEVHDELQVATPAEAPAPEPEPEAQMHHVVKGDTLSALAKHYYGDATKYPVIFEANRPLLSDPDKIYVGQVLRIPAL